MESHTLSALPLNPTSVPRRVYRFCEAESDTERSEYGAPTTSNRASMCINCQRHIKTTPGTCNYLVIQQSWAC
jgi:hypothetical protein